MINIMRVAVETEVRGEFRMTQSAFLYRFDFCQNQLFTLEC